MVEPLFILHTDNVVIVTLVFCFCHYLILLLYFVLQSFYLFLLCPPINDNFDKKKIYFCIYSNSSCQHYVVLCSGKLGMQSVSVSKFTVSWSLAEGEGGSLSLWFLFPSQTDGRTDTSMNTNTTSFLQFSTPCYITLCFLPLFSSS
jgi:hypothetical protein